MCRLLERCTHCGRALPASTSAMETSRMPASSLTRPHRSVPASRLCHDPVNIPELIYGRLSLRPVYMPSADLGNLSSIYLYHYRKSDSAFLHGIIRWSSSTWMTWRQCGASGRRWSCGTRTSSARLTSCAAPHTPPTPSTAVLYALKLLLQCLIILLHLTKCTCSHTPCCLWSQS